MKPIKISVIVCTHKRDAVLRKCLPITAKACAEVPNSELILVENGHKGEAEEIFEGLNQPGLKMSYLFVEEAGISIARNRGWAKASGDFIAFIDDDATPSDTWLPRLVSALSSSTEAVGCVGGAVDTKMPEPYPWWMNKGLLLYLSDFVERPDGPLHYPDLPRGANMCFLSRAMEEVRGFSEDIGRRGFSLAANEDIEIAERMIEKGWAVRFVSNAPVAHHIDPTRLTRWFFLKRFSHQGRGDALLAHRTDGWRGAFGGIGHQWRAVVGWSRAVDPGRVGVLSQLTAFLSYLGSFPGFLFPSQRQGSPQSSGTDFPSKGKP